MGVKPITMVHEMVIMLFFWPSCVVTRTTGPGSRSVKAVLMSMSFNSITPLSLSGAAKPMREAPKTAV